MKKSVSKARIAVFAVLSLAWIMPILIAILNSMKSNGAITDSLFSLPQGDGFVGLDNYVNAMTFGNYPFLKSFGYSVFISVVSTALIIVCCSMAAWYIVRVNSLFSKMFYYLCMFSLAVPFQMVMFTLTSTAYHLNL
ncbi:MAG: carbohydrate ABC transporter permease, partial [Eubacterium sp.]|nr:carbohydrate ABC transporter permease [Eubacterium sp.]